MQTLGREVLSYGSTFFGGISGKKLTTFVSSETKGSENLRQLCVTFPRKLKSSCNNNTISTRKSSTQRVVPKERKTSGGVVVESQSHSVVFAKW